MKKTLTILLILFTISTLWWASARIIKGYEFSINCTGHLKRAADANTVELASKELDTAIKYLESKELTAGTVSIFLKQPKNDIGFWYENLVASRQELINLKPDSGQLEKTNVLMKLRETLVDSGEDTSVTYPNGISIYPYNRMFCLWGIISLLGFCIMGLWTAYEIDQW